MPIRYGFMAFLAIICLAACGGGGGGGYSFNIPPIAPYKPSGDSSLSPYAAGATATGRTESSSQAVGRGPAQSGLTLAAPNSGVNGFKREFDLSALGLQGFENAPVALSMISGSSILEANYKNNNNNGGGWRSFFTSGLFSDVTTFSNGLVGLTFQNWKTLLTQETSATHNGYVGTLVGREVIMLGGGAVKGGLEYTNFGFWEDRQTFTGTHNGTSVAFTLNAYSPFILESNAAKKLAPSTGTFNGAVVANAYDRSNIDTAKVASLVGTAKLEVTSATAGTMTFSFPNFYTMTTGLIISSGSPGGALSNANFILSDAGKNTTGISLTSGLNSTINGQFYGAQSASTASEAVGTFGYNNPVQTIGVNGAFGVKK